MKVEFQSKNEVVYQMLKRGIIRGFYKPGSRLVIDQLAGELGISQIPIREAVRQLEADGFVTIEPYSGATVTAINADFIFEVFSLLDSIEVVCSRIACCIMTAQQLDELSDLIQRMDSSIHDADQWSQENKELHLLICTYAHATIAKKMMQKMLDHWDRLRLHYLQDVFGHRIKMGQQEHKQILAAFHTRNPDQVEQAVHTHNQNALAKYIEYLKSTGHISHVPGEC
jgi:DNA-binding GntR family transcriptional regulator